MQALGRGAHYPTLASSLLSLCCSSPKTPPNERAALSSFSWFLPFGSPRGIMERPAGELELPALTFAVLRPRPIMEPIIVR